MQAARIEETVVTPKVEQDILGIHYLITVFAQAFQNFGLAVGEFLLYSGMGQYLCDRVEMVITYLETGFFLFRFFFECKCFAHQRFNAYDKFLHAERLFQIVVGPEFKAFYHIIDGRTGGEKKYRSSFVGLTDVAYHFKTIHTRHHNICYQYIRA